MALSKDKVLKLETICTMSLLAVQFPPLCSHQVWATASWKDSLQLSDKSPRGNGKILNPGISSLGPRHFEGRDPFGQRYLQLDSCSAAWESNKISSLKGFLI